MSDKTKLKDFILYGDITPKQLVEMDVQEMASEEMKQKREKIKEDLFKSRQTDWAKNLVSEDGAYTCFKCKSSKTSYYQQQLRSADEPMTT